MSDFDYDFDYDYDCIDYDQQWNDYPENFGNQLIIEPKFFDAVIESREANAYEIGEEQSGIGDS